MPELELTEDKVNSKSIIDIEISYIATRTGKKICDGVPIGRHSITGQNIPQELRAKIVEYIVSIEKARRKMFEELHTAYFLRRGTDAHGLLLTEED